VNEGQTSHFQIILAFSIFSGDEKWERLSANRAGLSRTEEAKRGRFAYLEKAMLRAKAAG
jgi:hypothetical protein